MKLISLRTVKTIFLPSEEEFNQIPVKEKT